MSVKGFRRGAVSDGFLGGTALGGLGGILAVSFGLPGLTALGAVALLSLLKPPRFAFAAGMLTSAGFLWVFFSVEEVFRCATSPSSCSGASTVPFGAVSAIVLATGLFLLFVTRRRSRDKLLSSQAPKDGP
jgi:hypothetical protein